MFATYNCYILPAHLSLTLILLSLLNHCKKKKKKKRLFPPFFLSSVTLQVSRMAKVDDKDC